MKVKIGDIIYDSEKEPVMVILSNEDKENISNMGDAHCYCGYPEGDEYDAKSIEKWMNAKEEG